MKRALLCVVLTACVLTFCQCSRNAGVPEVKSGPAEPPIAPKTEPTAPAAKKLKVLFLCTGNSCRSQMAEAWTRHLKADCIEPYSAGIEKHGLNPNMLQVMKEAGVDTSMLQSKLFSETEGVTFDYVVTVCAHADRNCPELPKETVVRHIGFDDPPKLAKDCKTEEEKLDCYRRVRDEIKKMVESLPGILTEDGKK